MSKSHLPTDGLALVQQERPEVLQAYLNLLGTLGGSLEPRVRHLILISLQAAHGSNRALRHHVPRALSEGASAGEVLDAILLALPLVGLTRVAEVVATVHDLVGRGSSARPEPVSASEDIVASPEIIS